MADRYANRPETSYASRYLKGLKEIKGGEYTPTGYSGFYYIPQSPENWRILLSGKPNTGKTTCLGSFDKPMRIINCPGEKGIDSMPRGDGIEASYFRQTEGEYIDTETILLEFMAEVRQAINNPEVVTIAIDGVHKLYEHFLDLVTGGKLFGGMSFPTLFYGNAHALFDDFMSTMFYAKTPMVVFTTWCEREYLDPDLSSEEKKYSHRKVLPMLPGKMATHILGQINSGAIHCDITTSCNQVDCTMNSGKVKQPHHTWQLNPDMDKGDCGFKLPNNGHRLPNLINPDWQVLKQMLANIWQGKPAQSA